MKSVQARIDSKWRNGLESSGLVSALAWTAEIKADRVETITPTYFYDPVFRLWKK
jgi:hypothetical protein